MSAPRFPDRWERSAAAWKLLLKIRGCKAGTFPRGAQRAGKAAAGWGVKAPSVRVQGSFRPGPGRLVELLRVHVKRK